MRGTLTHDDDVHKKAATPDALLMDCAARRISRRYNVTLPLARVVAELVGASLENR
jgi:hypothetical protein